MWQPNRLMRRLGERDGWTCAYCECPLAHAPEHIEETEITDYLCCPSCNNRKGTQPVEVFLLGFIGEAA